MLESIPVEASNSVYSRRVSWIDPDTLIPLRVDVFQHGQDRPMKRHEVISQQKVDG